jgi:DNA-binding transcriptional regulator of glucitol operon
MQLLVLVGGSVVVVALVAWGIRRYQRDADELDQQAYRPPPVGGQAGPH